MVKNVFGKKNFKTLNMGWMERPSMDKKRLARVAIFSAFSILGSFIHPPSPIQSVAFDSWPGFFSALMFGSLEGSLVALIGHALTSVINGLPLGAFHIPIALGMGLVGLVVGVTNKSIKKEYSFIIALTVGIIINTLLALILAPWFSLTFSITIMPFILVAASLNAIVAGILYLALRKRIRV
jgi:uncharacterized membrane protein